jgi:hypothetical protein
MTEAEWLACTNPRPMLDCLQGKGSDRKLRLFACACCQRTWHLLKEPCLQLAIRVAEQFADSHATVEELVRASEPAWDTKYTLEDSEVEPDETVFLAAQAAASASCGPGNDDVSYLFRAIDTASDVVEAGGCTRIEEANLLHCIFGPLPFHPVEILSSWLAWSDGTVVKLAQSIYEDRDFDRLPILADALEEAGCHDSDILTHCRQPGEHVRGCWVVDLILGKE